MTNISATGTTSTSITTAITATNTFTSAITVTTNRLLLLEAQHREDRRDDTKSTISITTSVVKVRNI